MAEDFRQGECFGGLHAGLDSYYGFGFEGGFVGGFGDVLFGDDSVWGEREVDSSFEVLSFVAVVTVGVVVLGVVVDGSEGERANAASIARCVRSRVPHSFAFFGVEFVGEGAVSFKEGVALMPYLRTLYSLPLYFVTQPLT